MTHKTRLGPVAVFLTIVTMVVTTLALLTIATSNADRVMAGRFANITQIRYELEADGERFLADASAGDLSSAKASDGGYLFTEEKDGYRLEVRITEPDGSGGFDITRWKVNRIWQSADPINNIWQGF